MPAVPRRKSLAVTAALALGAGVITATTILPARAADDAARQVAERYAELVATADAEELEELWAMSATEDPGALRTAGEVLLTATERIEVVEVGDPRGTDENPGSPYPLSVEEMLEVPVTVELAGEERTWPVVVGLLSETSGRDLDDWRVLSGLTGSIDYLPRPPAYEVVADPYLGGIRMVRRPGVPGGELDEQPLYPAVYEIESRLDPYYTSDAEPVAVTGPEPTTLPALPLAPTETTTRGLRELATRQLDSCDDPDAYVFDCPLFELALELGNDYLSDPRWFRGFSAEPEIEVGAQEVTVTGVAGVRTDQGVRQIPFEGTGRHALDSVRKRPFLYPLELEVVR